jgi:hypothetical protein
VVTTWIAIKLVDENNKPIPRAKYIIIFSDNSRKEGDLDDDGYAYFDGIPFGDCTVGFPDFAPFWSFTSSLTVSKRTDPTWSGWANTSGSGAVTAPQLPPPQSIDIALLDEGGKGVPGEKFQIALPNGDVAQGFLEADGRTHVDGITPGGNCKISFPEIDAAFVQFEKSQ